MEQACLDYKKFIDNKLSLVTVFAHEKDKEGYRVFKNKMKRKYKNSFPSVQILGHDQVEEHRKLKKFQFVIADDFGPELIER